MDQKIINFLNKKNVQVVTEDINAKLESWEQWYRGKVDGVHDYKIYTGTNHINCSRKALHMPAFVCQRWADTLLTEKVEFTCKDANTEKELKRILQQVNFYVRGNNLLERAFALGGGFFIQYFDGEKTNQKYITQEFMYPISYDSGRLTEAAFSSKKVIDSKEYTYLEAHTLDAGGLYVVDNFLLTQKGKALYEVDENFYTAHGLRSKVETGSRFPLFQQIRPNVANRDLFDSPFGTSVYSGAVDVFETIDTIYDSYYNEFILGRKRIFVEDGMTKINVVKGENGERSFQEVFDPHDAVFYKLPECEDGRGEPVQESNPALRITEHDQAMQTQLNLLSQKVGFGSNAFKWENGSVSTATQIISENSDMFRTIKKHELILRDALVQMARGLLFVERQFAGNSAVEPDTEITVDFDDSIIEDTAEVKRQAMLELNSGLIDPVQYYVDVYKMTEAQAQAFYTKIQKRMPDVADEPEGA